MALSAQRPHRLGQICEKGPTFKNSSLLTHVWGEKKLNAYSWCLRYPLQSRYPKCGIS